MDSIWRDIVLEALEKSVSENREAVAGAKLKQLITSTAKAQGYDFPPEGHGAEKFADFIGHFDKDLVVFRRKGKDILVAPVGSASLLFEQERDTAPQLRSDVFKAFTQIPRAGNTQTPWYMVAVDQFTWLSDTSAVDLGETKPVPPATLETEIGDRQAFLEGAGLDEQTRNVLASTLTGHSALWAFSQALRTRGLAREWHSFRLERVLGRIRQWCKDVDVPWRTAWLADTVTQNGPSAPPLKVPGQREAFNQMFSSLSDSDIQRITVPLDVVLKLLQG